MRFPAPSRRAGLIAIAVACCGLTPALMAEEEVHLASGEVVTGELITETSTALEIRRQVLIKHNAVSATVNIAKDQITRREKVPAFSEQYKTRQKSTPDTLEGHIALARWSADHCLIAEAAQNAQRADDIDSDNPLVNKLFGDLGYVKIKEQWVREDEYLAKNGLVDYQGKIMTPAEAEKAKAIYLANQEHDDATQAIKDDQFYMAHGDEKVKELSDKLEKEKADASKAKGEVTAAKARIDADNKRQADLANQQANANGNGNGNNNGGGYGNRRNNQQQATPAQQVAKDLADATAAFEKATEDQHSADRLVASDQRKLTALQAAVAKSKDDLPVQQERLKKADADILALTGKAPPAAPSDDKAAADGKAGAAKTDATSAPTPPKSRFGN